jgi:DNA-binding sugar fermentation-stimulating protein
LDRIKYVLLLNKRHLKIELVEISRRAVRTGIFVAETRRDLEIFVIAGHHDQLFELLWRLGQRIEFTRVQT